MGDKIRATYTHEGVVTEVFPSGSLQLGGAGLVDAPGREFPTCTYVVELLEKALPVFEVGDVLGNSTGTRFLRIAFGGGNVPDAFGPQWRGTDDRVYGEDTLVSSIRMVGGYVLYRGSERIEL